VEASGLRGVYFTVAGTSSSRLGSAPRARQLRVWRMKGSGLTCIVRSLFFQAWVCLKGQAAPGVEETSSLRPHFLQAWVCPKGP